MAWLPASLLKTHRRLSTCATTMRVRFVYERRRYATTVKIRHGLATFNSNNSVHSCLKVRNIKCGYSFFFFCLFFSLNERNILRPKLSRFGEISVLQQNRIVYSNSMQGTLLSISSNGLGNKTFFMPVCSLVKLSHLGTVDELTTIALGRASGRRWYLGVIV